MKTTETREVVAVWFSWSWRGFGLRFADCQQETFPVEQLAEMVGSQEEAARLLAVATAGYGTGCWRSLPAKAAPNFADA